MSGFSQTASSEVCPCAVGRSLSRLQASLLRTWAAPFMHLAAGGWATRSAQSCCQSSSTERSGGLVPMFPDSRRLGALISPQSPGETLGSPQGTLETWVSTMSASGLQALLVSFSSCPPPPWGSTSPSQLGTVTGTHLCFAASGWTEGPLAYTCLRTDGLWSKKPPHISWEVLPLDKQRALESNQAGHTHSHSLCPALLQPDQPAGNLATTATMLMTPGSLQYWQNRV